MENKYVKMSDLVDTEFTVQAVKGFKFVAWDDAQSKYVTQDNWFQGAQKKYTVETDKGTVDISSSQLSQMLEGVCHSGRADINNATFHVKSNGKTGKEIRYFINALKVQPQTTNGAQTSGDSQRSSGYDQAKQKADSLREPAHTDADAPYYNEDVPF